MSDGVVWLILSSPPKSHSSVKAIGLLYVTSPRGSAGAIWFRPIGGIRLLSVCGIACLTDVFSFLSSFHVSEQYQHSTYHVHCNVFHPCFPRDHLNSSTFL